MSNESQVLLDHAPAVVPTPGPSPPPVPGLAIALVTLATVLYLGYRWALPKPIPGIPFDEAASKSIFGHTPDLVKFSKENNGDITPWFFKQLTDKNMPMVQVWIKPFQPPAVILSDPVELEDLLVRRVKEFNRGRGFKWLFGACSPEFHIAKTSGTPEYKRSMHLVRDLMTTKFLTTVSAPEVHRKAQMLIKLWKVKAKHAKGRPFMARPDLFDCVADMINAAAFALEDDLCSIKTQTTFMETLKDDEELEVDQDGAVTIPRAPETEVMEAFHELIKHQGRQGRSVHPPLEHLWDMLTKPQLRSAFKTIKTLINSEITKSLERIGNKKDASLTSALDQMLIREQEWAEKNGTKPEYYHGRIRDEVFGYYTAGHETSATSVSWMTRYFGHRPDWQDKLRQELHATFSAAVEEKREPGMAEINAAHLPYLEAFTEETLRVWPPFFQTRRDTMCDTTLLGVHIPKGTEILIPSGGPGFSLPAMPCAEELHSDECRQKARLPAWGPEDIAVFKPERWLVEDEATGEVTYNPRAGPTMAFSYGPRKCFGQRLAYMQIRNLAVLLLWNFRFKRLEGRLASMEPQLIMSTLPRYTYVALETISY